MRASPADYKSALPASCRVQLGAPRTLCSLWVIGFGYECAFGETPMRASPAEYNSALIL